MAIKFTDNTDDDGKPKKPVANVEPAKITEAAPKPAKPPAIDGDPTSITPSKGGPKFRGRSKAFG